MEEEEEAVVKRLGTHTPRKEAISDEAALRVVAEEDLYRRGKCYHKNISNQLPRGKRNIRVPCREGAGDCVEGGGRGGGRGGGSTASPE